VPFEGWTQRLAKADRGERQGKYAIIIELDTADRDRYVPEDNQLSAEGERHAASLSDLMTKFATFSSTTPGVNTVFSDYVVVDR
jgi:hypothetical protein